MPIVKVTKNDLVGRGASVTPAEYKFEIQGVKVLPQADGGNWFDVDFKLIENEEYANIYPIHKRFFSIADLIPVFVAMGVDVKEGDDLDISNESMKGRQLLGVAAPRSYTDKRDGSLKTQNDITAFRPIL